MLFLEIMLCLALFMNENNTVHDAIKPLRVPKSPNYTAFSFFALALPQLLVMEGHKQVARISEAINIIVKNTLSSDATWGMHVVINCQEGSGSDRLSAKDGRTVEVLQSYVRNALDRNNMARRSRGLPEIDQEPEVFLCSSTNMGQIAESYRDSDGKEWILINRDMLPAHLAENSRFGKIDLLYVLDHESGHIGQLRSDWRIEPAADRLAEGGLRNARIPHYKILGGWWKFLVELAGRQGIDENELLQQLYLGEKKNSYNETFLRKLIISKGWDEFMIQRFVKVFMGGKLHMLSWAAQLLKNPKTRSEWQGFFDLSDQEVVDFLRLTSNSAFEEDVINSDHVDYDLKPRDIERQILESFKENFDWKAESEIDNLKYYHITALMVLLGLSLGREVFKSRVNRKRRTIRAVTPPSPRNHTKS